MTKKRLPRRPWRETKWQIAEESNKAIEQLANYIRCEFATIPGEAVRKVLGKLIARHQSET